MPSNKPIEERRRISRAVNKANKEIAIEMLESLDNSRLVMLDKALSRNEALTSTYGFPFGSMKVYKEGWYLTLEGTRSGFSIWAYDEDGTPVPARKPNDSQLNLLYEDSLTFND